jgi:hypothetical protein
MNFSLIALLGFVAAMLFGIAYVIAPEQAASIYGVSGWNAGTVLIGRLFGVGFLFMAAAMAAIRTCTDNDLQRRFAKYFAVANLLAAIVVAQGALTAAGNGLLWSSVIGFLFFTAAWGRIAFRRQQ